MALQRVFARPKSWLSAYNGLLETKPLQTKLSTSFVIFSACELNAQLIMSETAQRKGFKATLSDRFGDVKWAQVAGFGCFALYNAPVMHTFFKLGAHLSLPTRVIINSVLVDPVNIAVAMLLSSVNKGSSLQDSCEMLSDRYLPTMERAFTFWPPAHLLNNFFVPVQYRVLGFTTAAAIWNTYLCWMMQNAKATEATVKAAVTDTAAVNAAKVEVAQAAAITATKVEAAQAAAANAAQVEAAQAAAAKYIRGASTVSPLLNT